MSVLIKKIKMAEVNRAQISEKMHNIAKFEGENDSLTTSVKFGVLIGLIKVDSVSNKEVVNTILQLVSENPFKNLCWTLNYTKKLRLQQQ